jgi:hypothetical protein
VITRRCERKILMLPIAFGQPSGELDLRVSRVKIAQPLQGTTTFGARHLRVGTGRFNLNRQLFTKSAPAR